MTDYNRIRKMDDEILRCYIGQSKEVLLSQNLEEKLRKNITREMKLFEKELNRRTDAVYTK